MTRTLTDKEQTAFDKFAGLIAHIRDPLHTDRDLVRWLQAKGWNPQRAEDLYKKNAQWRKEQEIERLTEEYVEPEVMTRYYAGGVVGKDKDGNIIRVDPSGKNDVRGFLRSVKKEDLSKTIVVRIERTIKKMRENRQKDGSTGDQVIQIIDMGGYSQGMDMSVINFYLETMTTLDNHYPGLMKKGYVINVPTVFRMGWNFMKRFLSKEISETFELFDSSGPWKERLREELPVDQLPAAYGGTITDPDGDEWCKTLVNYGGEVPKTYYRTVESCLPPNLSETTHVGRADILKLEATVGRTPALISWVFASEGNPVKFGLYRETSPGGGKHTLDGLTEVQAFKDVDSHVIPEDGSYMCDTPGKYFLIFDNRASRFTRRKVIYQLKVVEDIS